MANPCTRREPRRSPADGDHERLEAWKLAVEVAIESYQLTAGLQLTGGDTRMRRIRRSAVAVVSGVEQAWRARAAGGLAPRLEEARTALAELDAATCTLERPDEVHLASFRRHSAALNQALDALCRPPADQTTAFRNSSQSLIP